MWPSNVRRLNLIRMVLRFVANAMNQSFYVDFFFKQQNKRILLCTRKRRMYDNKCHAERVSMLPNFPFDAI